MNLRPGAWSCVSWLLLSCCLAVLDVVALGEHSSRDWSTGSTAPHTLTPAPTETGAYTSSGAFESKLWPDEESSWLAPGTDVVTPVQGEESANRFNSLTTVEEWSATLFSTQADDEFQFLPVGLLYRSYLAGPKESRLAASWMQDDQGRLVWETALGARIGIFRVGTDDIYRPEGWQLDLEGAALPRVLPEEISSPLEATDFRIAVMSTWRRGDWAVKAGYNHLSAHAGDEYLVANPNFVRLNYVRDSFLTGVMYDLTESIQSYGEMGYAFNAEDGARPLEFQYGLQYSPYEPNGLKGSPFVAVNGQTREDLGWITGTNVMAGWQWRGQLSPSLWRIGMQYYTGPAYQWEFVGRKESLLGGGVWFDF